MVRSPLILESLLLIVTELVPAPRSTLPLIVPPLKVTLSLPLPLFWLPPRVPAPELKVRVLLPSPRFKLPLRPPPEEKAVVSLPAPKVTFSRFEKTMEPVAPRVPESEPETVRVSAIVVEVR